MITYNDMAFCTATDCAGYKECYRALTKEVEKAAKDSGLPMSVFCEPPMCYKPTKETKK